MIICLPTMGDRGLKEKVHNHFGSAGFFTIYNSDLKTVKTVQNRNVHHSHGACQPLSSIEDHKVDIVLTSGMGRRALRKLNMEGIKVYTLEGETVEEAVKRFEEGNLSELTVDRSCQHHGCH